MGDHCRILSWYLKLLLIIRESEAFNLPLIILKPRGISLSAGFTGKLIYSDSLKKGKVYQMSNMIFSKKKLKTILLVAVFIFLYSFTAWAGLTKTDVSQLYVSIFGRASEGEGNAYWQTDRPDMISTANAMLGTNAAKDYFGANLNSDQAFIEYIYLNTLSKTLADDPSGIAYWVGELEGGKSRGEVAVSLVGVIKDYAPGGPYYNPGDAKTIAAYNQFTNRVEVSNYMATTVQIAPGDWAISTSFTGKLVVTDEPATLRAAEQIIGAMGGTTYTLNDDIEYYMTMVSSVGEMSPMISELSTLFEQILAGDSSVVTISPSLETWDLSNIPPAIKITSNFGAGYTPQDSTSVFTGQAVIDATNIALTETGITANVALTATNVKRDGQMIMNGLMGLSLDVGMAGNDIAVSASINFTNLQSLTENINGGASLSMSINSDGEISQPITLTINQLTSTQFEVSGTVTITPVGTDSYDALFDLDTDKGAVEGTVRMVGISGDQVVISTPGSPLKAADINLDINDVTMDSNVCPDSPSSGNILFTRGAETSTMTFNNCTQTLVEE